MSHLCHTVRYKPNSRLRRAGRGTKAPNEPNLVRAPRKGRGWPPDPGGHDRAKQSQFPAEQKEGQRLGGKRVMVNGISDRPQQNEAKLGRPGVSGGWRGWSQSCKAKPICGGVNRPARGVGCTNKANSGLPGWRQRGLLCETKPIWGCAGRDPQADYAKRSQTWAGWDIWGTARPGRPNGAKRTQFSDCGLRIQDSLAAGRPCGPPGPGPVVQTNPIRQGQSCQTNPIPTVTAFGAPIIPPFPPDADCVKQTQFPAVPGRTRRDGGRNR
jgi:hypothetical protein